MQRVLESMNASNFLLVGNQTGNSTKKTDENIMGFADILTETESSGQNVKEEQNIDKPNTGMDSSDYSDSQNVDSVKKDVVIRKEENVQNETAEIDTELSVEEQEVLLETIGTVLEMVMKQFGLSEEELAEQLKAFGMEMNDLFSAEGLKEFFLQMNEADVSDLLVNEDLNQELQTFLDEFHQILSENDVTSEQLTDVLKDVDVKEILTEVSNLKDVADKKDIVTSDDKLVPEERIEQKEPEVIVQNEQNVSSGREHFEAKKENVFSKNTEAETNGKPVKQDGFENPILQAIQDAVSRVEGTVINEQPVQGREIIEQIVEQIRINMNQDTTSMEMQLYPEHLGKIQINVVSKDGVMTAKIVAETEAAKQAIESGLTNLKDSMEQQNLKVEAIEVMVSTTGFDKSNEDQAAYEEKNASKGGKKHLDLSELSEAEEEPDAESERMKAMGNSVSYTA